ncbi:hypothetical protein pb186bvf_013857 [Paramecium bursaria]
MSVDCSLTHLNIGQDIIKQSRQSLKKRKSISQNQYQPQQRTPYYQRMERQCKNAIYKQMIKEEIQDQYYEKTQEKIKFEAFYSNNKVIIESFQVDKIENFFNYYPEFNFDALMNHSKDKSLIFALQDKQVEYLERVKSLFDLNNKFCELISLRQSQERNIIHRNSPNRLNPIVNQTSEFNKLVDLNREYTSQVDELKKQHLYMETQLIIYQESEKKNQQEINDMKIQNRLLQEQIKDLQFKIGIEKKDVQIYQQQVLKLEEECNYQTEALKTQKAQLEAMQEKVESMQNRHQIERQTLRQQLLEKEQECKQMQFEMRKSIENQKKNIQIDSKQLENEKNQLEQKVQGYHNEYATFKQQKLAEIRQLNDQIGILHYRNQLLEAEQKTKEALELKLKQSQQEIDNNAAIQKQLNTQIQQLQQAQAQFTTQTNQLKEEKQLVLKEKQAIESYYLEQLSKQDQQLQQLLKNNIQQEQKQSQIRIQHLLDQKDNAIKDLNNEISVLRDQSYQKLDNKIVKDLEKKNTTLVMEVERLNNILKMKLTELENQQMRQTDPKIIEELEMWKNKFIQLNKQYHQSQEQLMVAKTELDSLKKPRTKENVEPLFK